MPPATHPDGWVVRGESIEILGLIVTDAFVVAGMTQAESDVEAWLIRMLRFGVSAHQDQRALRSAARAASRVNSRLTSLLQAFAASE